MNRDPMRWRDPASDVPAELRDLLAAEPRSSAMPGAVENRMAGRAAATALLPRGASLARTWIWRGVFGGAGLGTVAVVIGLVLSRQPVPDKKSAIAPRERLPSPAETVLVPSSGPIAPAPVPPATPVHVSGPPPLPAAPQPAAHSRAPAATAGEEALARETALLQAAQAALATDPSRALALATVHRREFPQGQLAAERELIAVDALLRLGRRGEASARGEALVARDPHGLYVERVRELLQKTP